MMIRLAYLANYFLERDIAGRSLYKLPDDVFIVAYPGSGGQWLRSLVGNLLNPSSPVTEKNVMSRLPDLYHVSRRSFAKMRRPRVIFSHECFDAECPKVIYLVRDPRDVAVALYDQRCQGGSVERDMNLEQFVQTLFLTDNEWQHGWSEEFSGSIKRNQGFGYRSRLKDEFLGTPTSWGENVMSWLGARGRDPNALLIIHYEALFRDPQTELGKIGEFLGLAEPEERIRSAVGATRSQPAPQSPGKWTVALSETAAEDIESEWGPVMTAIGYALEADGVGDRH
jgi:Sulfotransferase domain